MPKAEGLTKPFESEKSIDTKILETFAYKGPRQHIEYVYEEFSAVCPFSGLPDFGTVIVEYIPAKKCVELKSLKYYYMSYRNVGIYQEAVTSRLYNDIYAYLKPERLVITTIYKTRGGIDTTCVVDSKDQ